MASDSSESRQGAQPDEKLDNLESNFGYETLKKSETQDDSVYAELTNNDVASQSEKIGKGF